MGIINRVEHGLAKAVHGAFAKAFKSEVQPVEIASAIRRAMDDRAALLGHGRAMVPNLYTIELSQTDYERLGDYEEDLSDDLVAAAQEHADSQGYQPGGPSRCSSSRARASRPASSACARPPPSRPGASRRPRAGPAAAGRRPRRHGRRRGPGPRPAPRSNPSARPWLDIGGDRYPLLGSLTTARPRRDRRHRHRRPRRLAPAQRDPRHDRRPAPRDLDPRPQLHQRHLRQRRAHLEPAAPGRRPPHDRPHVRDLPRGTPVSPMTSTDVPPATTSW